MIARLDSGDLSFLKDVDPVKADEAARLGSGAAFYLSIHASINGNAALEKALLASAWEKDTGIWKREAGNRLLRHYADEAQWEEGLPFIKVYATVYSDDYAAGLLLIKALAETSRETDAAAEIVRFKARFDTARKTSDSLSLELLSIKTLAAAGDSGWQEQAIALALNRDKDTPVLDAVKFLMADETRYRNIPETTKTYLELRRLVALKDYGPAMVLAESGKGFLFAADLADAVLADAGKAWLYGGGAKTGLKEFKAFLARKNLKPELAYTARFYLARFEKELKLPDDAAESFEQAAALAFDPGQRDAALWYFFDAISNRSPKTITSAIARYAGTFSNPSYFSDILNRFCVEFAQKKDFSAVDALRSAVLGHANPATQARLAYISGRAAESGFIPGGMETARKRFKEALDLDTNSWYYRFLSSIRLGEPITLVGEEITTKSPDSSKPPERSGDTEQFLDGFLAFGLASKVYGEAVPKLNNLSNDSLRRYARVLAEKFLYADSIRFISQLYERPGFIPTKADLELYYPRPFFKEIHLAAEEFHIPEYVFYALIRTESAFIPDIVSRSGAVGLSQLMPPTAEQAAKTMGLTSWSLTSPQDNLRIGAYYLDYLNSRLDGRIMYALFAYNGGIGRVKRWIAEHPTLPDDLFLETIPFDETRGYGQKVLAAAAVYGYLYYGLKPETIAREIAGGMK